MLGIRLIQYIIRAKNNYILDENKREREGVETLLDQLYPSQKFKGKVHGVEHHYAHLLSTRFCLRNYTKRF